MKSHIRIALFALLVPVAPLAACGGERHDDEKGLWFTVPTLPTRGAVAPVGEPTVAEVMPTSPAVVAPAPVEDVMPTTFKEAMQLGVALAAKGDVSRAREVLEAAAKLDRKAAEPHIELARLFIGQGERGLAIKHASKAVKLAPESSQAYNTLGRAELARFDYDAAVVAFRQATELNADNVYAWNNLGFAYLTLKQYQDAADALVVATAKKGATGYMFNNLGTAYEHLDQLDDARSAFDKGSDLGSKEAALSRKRLEGVDTIAVVQKPAAPAVEEPKTYENAEPMPEDPADEAPVPTPADVAPGDAGSPI